MFQKPFQALQYRLPIGLVQRNDDNAMMRGIKKGNGMVKIFIGGQENGTMRLCELKYNSVIRSLREMVTCVKARMSVLR